MNITREEVIQVARLARLEPDAETIDRMCAQIGKVLEYVAQLNEVQTETVFPTSHALDLTNAFREDVEGGHLDRKLALSNAPEKEDGDFLVPKVIRG